MLNCYSAFNAIVSSSVVLLDLAYGIPIAVNCCRGRKMLPERAFVLPNALGWVLNIVSSSDETRFCLRIFTDRTLKDFIGLRRFDHRSLPLPSGSACHG